MQWMAFGSPPNGTSRGFDLSSAHKPCECTIKHQQGEAQTLKEEKEADYMV